MVGFVSFFCKVCRIRLVYRWFEVKEGWGEEPWMKTSIIGLFWRAVYVGRSSPSLVLSAFLFCGLLIGGHGGYTGLFSYLCFAICVFISPLFGCWLYICCFFSLQTSNLSLETLP